jgi:N-acetylmuramoyl-L-alanine amidase
MTDHSRGVPSGSMRSPGVAAPSLCENSVGRPLRGARGMLRLILVWSLAGAVPAAAAVVDLPGAESVRLASWKVDGVTYVRATELFGALGGTVDYGPYPAAATAHLNGHSVTMYSASPFVRLDSTVFSLSLPVLLREGDVTLPLATATELLARIYGARVKSSGQDDVAQVRNKDLKVGTIQGELMRNGMILQIPTGGPVDYEVYPSMDDWLNISIPGAAMGKVSFDRRPFARYIWEFKSYQLEGSIQLSFRFQPGRVRWEHRLVPDPYRIEVTLYDTTFQFDSADAPGVLQPPSAGLDLDPIDVIVVDAGHGGDDLGAVGRRGVREKDIVLGVALELARLLKDDPKFKVILTRSDDRFIPLKRRAEIANEANADLFISLHANSAPRKGARGFETFFLSAAKSDEARATEQLENASLRFEESHAASGTDDLDFILTDLLQNQFLVESADLAQTIQSEFSQSLSVPDRGVNQAGFVVLYQAYMPAVLVETGFISNADEELWLSAKSNQKKLAHALYRSIVSFRQKSEEKL